MELGLDVRKVGSHSVVDVKGEIDVYTRRSYARS